jgi:hypothetical protein
MKLNRAWLVATVTTVTAMAAVGTLTVVGINRSSDTDDPRVVAEMAATEQTGEIDGDTSGTPATNGGVEQYRGGSHGGGSHGVAHGGGGHGWHGGGYTHGGTWGRGYGHGYGYGRGYGRGWGGSSRWGRWGGGRYVGGRWVDGPYYGWCDARYYECSRAWW